MKLRVEAAVCSSIGRRINNEDNFYVNGRYMEREQMNRGGQYNAIIADEVQIYAVCDGMGGAEYGEEASLTAVKALARYQRTCAQPDNSRYLGDMIDATSAEVDQISLDKGTESGSCGSTIAMIVMRNDNIRFVHVGDSRVYRLRDGKLMRMTRDDSEVQNMVDRGEITADQAWNHPRKNVITRHLGMPLDGTKLIPTISARQLLNPGDIYMICSDGVSDQMRDASIQEVLTQAKTPEEAAENLVRNALRNADEAGIKSDNITCIVLSILQPGEAGYDEKKLLRLKLMRGIVAGVSVAALGLLGYNIVRLVQLLR